MAMSNNDILKSKICFRYKRYRYGRNFKLGGMEVTKEDVVDMLTK